MPPVEIEDLQRLRMSYQDWLALPELPKSEWVDGEVVVSPPAAPHHQDASFSLASRLKRDLPRLHTYMDVGVQLPRNRLRVPDVMVVERAPQGLAATDPPVLVVEVLSPSTRGEDTVRKSGEYLAGGAGQYWIVDTSEPSIEIYVSAGGGWDLLLRLDASQPTGSVEVGDHGTVRLDLPDVLLG